MNGNNGPGDSAGRCSFLCPVCLRKVWLALSFTPSGPTNSVLSRYQAILQLMQALAVKFKEMEVLDEMTELLGDIDWLEKRMTSLG